ncbi:MAG TPA: DUF4234 domain-containing protein [archaeon]|nr:DUF4234 domain-containing protein [archaeon]HLD81400.1 DUF4234 domain-containing protein [archaeon]
MVVKERNPLVVVALTLITFGLYGVYWYVQTKGELNELGGSVPTAWLLLAGVIPVVGILAVLYWLWKYTEAVAGVLKKDPSKHVVTFAMFILPLVNLYAMYSMQQEMNKHAKEPSAIPQAISGQ